MMRVQVDLGEVALDTVVIPAYVDEDERAHPEVLLADLVAEQLAAQVAARDALTLAGRVRDITDKVIEERARVLVADVLDSRVGDPGLPVEHLSVAELIARHVEAHIEGRSGVSSVRGKPSTMIEAIIATAVTEKFRAMAPDVVDQVIAAVRADIAAQPR
jgi:hypothetical protein